MGRAAMSFRELIWQHPELFAWTVGITLSVVGSAIVYWSFSFSQGGDDD